MIASAPLKVVLIGLGPVGVRFAEELLPAVAAGSVALTIVAAEDADPYNRVLVAEYAVGAVAREDLAIADTDSLTDAGVRVLRGLRARHIDRDNRRVLLSDDSSLPYDRAVLATGARANVPVLDGLERWSTGETVGAEGLDDGTTAGVCVLRTAADAEQVRDVVAAGGRVVILGAGVLGIELALLLAAAGVEPTIAHFGPTPMPRQLDRGAATVLCAALEQAGVHVVPHMRAEAIIARTDADDVRRFRALVASDGRSLEGDLLVLSCGVTARTELAQGAGLRVGGGVLVDHRLRSWTDPSISAIGDCAHVAVAELHAHDRDVPGGPSGLVGPGWRQAEWLAKDLLAGLAGLGHPVFEEDVPGVVMLKDDRIGLVAAGDVSPEPFAPVVRGEIPARVALWADLEHGTYTKMVTREGVLTGFVSIGMPRAAAELSVLYSRRGELPADRSLLLRLDAADDGAPRATGRDAPVCLCNAVTAGAIEDAVAHGCSTVAEVGRATRAGTGCGGCRARIAEMIGDFGALEGAAA